MKPYAARNTLFDELSRPRPVEADVMPAAARRIAAAMMANEGEDGEPDDELVETVREAMEAHQDGYQRMRHIERECYWEGSEALVEILAMADCHHELDREVREWVVQQGIEATLQVGQRVAFMLWNAERAEGVIDSIDARTARYACRVEAGGKTWMIPFERVTLLTQEEA